MDGLHSDVFMIKRRRANAVGNLHKVERFAGFTEDDLHFVANAARTHKAPLRKPPTVGDLFEAFIDFETTEDQLTARHASLE